MSLNWNWKEDKVGTWTEKHGDMENTYNLYSGNALLIMIAEWNEDGIDKYQVASFFCDKDHMKNCLGLNKDYKQNIYCESLIKIELSAGYRNTPFILQQIAKAKFDNPVEIKLLPQLPW